jgi:hypothetical protein
MPFTKCFFCFTGKLIKIEQRALPSVFVSWAKFLKLFLLCHKYSELLKTLWFLLQTNQDQTAGFTLRFSWILGKLIKTELQVLPSAF